jgi:DNA-nicking Smr family endonuclease
MKKKKKPAQKTQVFASRPFGALKGVRPEQTAEPPKEAAHPVQAEKRPDDQEEFLRAVADVRPLHPERNPPPGKGKAPPGKLAAVDEEERRLFLETVGGITVAAAFRDELPDGIEPVKPLAVNRVRELKRGALRIDFQLDLHGLTRDEALHSLASFITGAFNRGQKAVLVITGKGNRSPGEPVLQGAVTGWLREQGKGMVAEFAPAPRDMGGSGAFVVFLKHKE